MIAFEQCFEGMKECLPFHFSLMPVLAHAIMMVDTFQGAVLKYIHKSYTMMILIASDIQNMYNCARAEIVCVTIFVQECVESKVVYSICHACNCRNTAFYDHQISWQADQIRPWL